MRKSVLFALCASLLVATLGSACKPEQKAPEQPPATENKAPEANKAETQTPPTEAKPTEEAKPGETGTTAPAEGGGQWVTSNTYETKFRVPEDWKIDINDDGITATDADDTTTVVLVGSESEGMIQSAVNDVKKRVKIKDAKFEKSGQVVLNGLPAQNVTGTAVVTKEDGMDQEIQFIAYNVKVGKKAVTIMIFSEAEMYEAKKEIIDGIAQTLTKAS